MREILALVSLFEGALGMLLFNQKMTVRAWVVYGILVSVLICLLVWSAGAAFESLANGIKAFG